MRTALLLLLAGCAWGNYRVVRETPEGGEVALTGSDDDGARKKAEEHMAKVCPRGYTIAESEALAGDDSVGRQPAKADVLGHTAQPSAAYANEDRRESRLTFRCK